MQKGVLAILGSNPEIHHIQYTVSAVPKLLQGNLEGTFKSFWTSLTLDERNVMNGRMEDLLAKKIISAYIVTECTDEYGGYPEEINEELDRMESGPKMPT